jgi:predicted NBD/HSP70 family sugar kinase
VFGIAMSDKAEKAASPTTVLVHGGSELVHVTVDAYNAELRTADGFVGDRASKRAFQSILDEWRERLADMGVDPLGDAPSDDLSKRQLDKILKEGDPEAAGVIHSAIEEFAQEFVAVIRRFLRLKEWQDTECIVVGGGLRQSRIGELAIGRAAVELKGRGIDIELRLIRYPSDHAGLVGSVHLVPSWMLAGHDSIIAADIGGTNIRAGIVHLNLDEAADLSAASVGEVELWRHSDDAPKRDEAVERLIGFFKGLIKRANKDGHQLAPFIAIGCPGVIRPDGTIEKGGQNLPGNWEAKSFNLVQEVCEAIPKIGDHETVVLMHNDAVVQGLSELPWMRDVTSWGVMTIGTGLGNAHFTNKERREKSRRKNGAKK